MRKKRKVEPNALDPPSKRLNDKDDRIPKQRYRIVQIGLQSIVKNQATKERITKCVLNLHKLAIQTYQFIALYLTHVLQYKNESLPHIDEIFVQDLERLIIRASSTRGKLDYEYLSLRKPKEGTSKEVIEKKLDDNVIRLVNRFKMTNFMNEHYHSLMATSKQGEINNVGLSQSINFLAKEIVTALNTNIQEHYEDYLLRFCKAIYSPTKTGDELKAVCSKTKRMILKCDYDFEVGDPILEHLTSIVPHHKIEKSIYYDLKINQQSYLPSMFYMNSYFEENEFKQFSLFPLRTSIMPLAMRIDTRVLTQQVITDSDRKHIKEKLEKKQLLTLTDADMQNIWSHFFKTNMHCFSVPKIQNDTNPDSCHYKFSYSIVTDGVTCSITQTIPDDDSVYRPVDHLPGSRGKYIQDPEVDLKSLRDMTVVGCDPGKQDLLYFACPNGNEIDPNSDQKRQKLKTVDRFRYSQAQRKFECKTKYFNSIREQEKQKARKVQGKTVQQWEHTLSFYSKKTTDFEKLTEYVRQKNLVNSKIFGFWAKEEFRQLKWKAKKLKQISEEKMMKAFKEKFGPPKSTIIALGNWSQFHPRPGTEPTKTKKFRTLFKNQGYQYFLVDEFRTSKCCHNCGYEVVQKFLPTLNPKLKKKKTEFKCPCETECDGCKEKTKRERKPLKQYIKCHGLTWCPNAPECGENGTFWNRDLNGALNIRKIAVSVIFGERYPAYLSRRDSTGEEIVDLEEEFENESAEENDIIQSLDERGVDNKLPTILEYSKEVLIRD